MRQVSPFHFNRFGDSVMADETKNELAEYQKDLLARKQRLVDYGRRQGSMRLEHAPQDIVLISAIDGILTQLNTADPATILLQEIVSLAENAQTVLASADQFLARREAAPR
jgi:hypothetical protein